MFAHRISRLLLLVVIFLTPCSMAVESKKKKNKQVLNETKEKKEPKLGYFRARLKQEMHQVITLRCDGTENPTGVSTRETLAPSSNPSISSSTANPSNLPSLSLTKSVMPSVYPTQSADEVRVEYNYTFMLGGTPLPSTENEEQFKSIVSSTVAAIIGDVEVTVLDYWVDRSRSENIVIGLFVQNITECSLSCADTIASVSSTATTMKETFVVAMNDNSFASALVETAENNNLDFFDTIVIDSTSLQITTVTGTFNTAFGMDLGGEEVLFSALLESDLLMAGFKNSIEMFLSSHGTCNNENAFFYSFQIDNEAPGNFLEAKGKCYGMGESCLSVLSDIGNEWTENRCGNPSLIDLFGDLVRDIAAQIYDIEEELDLESLIPAIIAEERFDLTGVYEEVEGNGLDEIDNIIFGPFQITPADEFP